MVEPPDHSLLTLTSELNVHLFQCWGYFQERKYVIFFSRNHQCYCQEKKLNLYLLQGLPEDKFSSADVLVGEKCPNLVEVKLSGEVAGDGGDDVAHGEAAGVELLEDLLPVTLKMAPSRKST